MDALEFLSKSPANGVSATDFLAGKSPRSFADNALEFLTMGHIRGEYGPEKEVSFDASGKMTRADVPSGDPGFFQDPVTALAMGGVAGVRAAGGIVNKGLAAGREALGWLTGGGSEAPALAKAGVKGVVKAAEAKPLAKAAVARQEKGVLESITPEAKISAETITEAAGKAAPKATVSAEQFLTGSVTGDAGIVQPGATSQGIKRTPGISIEETDPVFVAMNDIKKGGGLNKEILLKDYGPETVKELMKKRPGIVTNKGTLRLDEFAGDSGFADGDTLMNAMLEGQTKKQFQQKMAGEVDARTGGNWDIIKKGYEPAPSIEAYNLGKGDKVIRNGEVFKVTDDQGGKLTLKDGETITVPMDETLKIDGVKKNPRFSEQTGDLGPEVSFENTFDLVSPETEIGSGVLSKKNMTPTASLDSIIPEMRGGVQAGNLPKYAEGSAINLERLNTAEDVKQFINQRAKASEEKIGKRKVSWDETRATAESLGWDERAIRREWKRKGAFTAAEIDATRQTNLNAIADLQTAIRDLPANQTTLPPELRAKVLDAMEMIKVTSQAASEAGRSLNIHKRVLSSDPSFRQASEMQRAMKAVAGKGGKLTDKLIDGLRQLDFNDPAAVNRFIYSATRTRWQKLSSGAFQLWLEGMLSQPLSHIVNATSNALTLTYQYPERVLAAGIEAGRAKLAGNAREMFFGETAQDIFSISKGLQDAVARFSHTMKYGERITKLDHPPSAFPDKVSRFLPTRALAAEDAFFKGFIENQELNRLAYRQAVKEGLSGRAFKDRISNLLQNPTEQMLNDAARRGQYLTYQQEVGEIGRLIFNARDKVPGLKFFIPFVKTPINIAKFALERTPLNLPLLAGRAIKGDLRGAQLSEELAKPLMGTMLATTVYQLAEQGYITGGTPKQRAAREEKQNVGWQPYSVKIGDKYYSFARLEPLGSIMGMAADLSQLRKEAQEDARFNLASGIMGSITTNISNKTFMQGFTNMIQAISDPGRYGANVVKSLAGSVIPAVSGGVARSADDTVRDIRGPIDTIKSRIPGVSSTMPAKLTVWGDPVQRPGTAVGRFVSPMQISQEKGSPIERELMKLDIDIGYPSKSIQGYEIPQDEYWRMVEASGAPAKKTLNNIVASGKWDRLSNSAKERVVSTVVNTFRDAERSKLEAKFIKQGKIKAVKQ